MFGTQMGQDSRRAQKDIIVYEKYDFGHRPDYAAVLTRVLGGEAIMSPPTSSIFIRLLSARAVLFSTFDDAMFLFGFIMLIRGMIGKYTCGLLLRPNTACRPKKIKHFIKRALLKAIYSSRKASVITIIPFKFDSAYQTIARGWIFDPQLWDLRVLPVQGPAVPTKLRLELEGLSKGRRVLLALGQQNASKGFEFFCRVWCSSAELRAEAAFIAAGPVFPTSKQAADDFIRNGGLLVDRSLSDAELLDLYSLAFAVWACYSPVYDQASGVFGRAVQLGVPAVVRANSILANVAADINHPIIAVTFDKIDEFVGNFIKWLPQEKAHSWPTLSMTEQMKVQSVSTLRSALLT